MSEQFNRQSVRLIEFECVQISPHLDILNGYLFGKKTRTSNKDLQLDKLSKRKEKKE